MLKIFVLLLSFMCLSGCWDNPQPTPSAPSQQDTTNIDKNQSTENTFAEPKKLILPTRDFTLQPDDMFLGNKNAKIVLVEYFSPTCPHCVGYHKRTLPELKARYIDTNQITYISREFIGNKQDLDATILARCKGDLDSYLKFIEAILKSQDNWAFDKKYREILTNIGSLGGVSPEEYANCLNNDSLIHTLVENTKLLALDPKFIGTPSFFINGKIFTQPYTFEELSKALEAELKKKN
jgi:protein-disulfide isomerase